MSETVKPELRKESSAKNNSGPRTKVGKQRSSRNAIKHGIFSDVIVLPGESRAEYQLLLNELWEATRPQGRLEELLVEKAATYAWRLRRLLAAEGAEIRESRELCEWDKQIQERQREANQSRGVDVNHIFDADLGLIFQTKDPEILTYCVESLGHLREEIASGGFDEEQDTAILEKIYGPDIEYRKTLHNSYIMWQHTSEASTEERQKEGYASPEQCKDNVLAEIGKEIRRLRTFQKRQAAIETERAKLKVLRRSVPEPAALDRLLRYEASLERGFDRTLSQLERIQRLRRGQPVAPRIEVDVSA